jgi:osmotically inducible lipoprotein OsmB
MERTGAAGWLHGIRNKEIKMKRLIAIVFSAGALVGLTACESVPFSKQTQGAAIGAAAGGVAGHVIGGGSTLGTVGGAVAGGVIGSEVGKRQ